MQMIETVRVGLRHTQDLLSSTWTRVFTESWQYKPIKRLPFMYLALVVTVSLAATSFGYVARVTLVPQSWQSGLNIESFPFFVALWRIVRLEAAFLAAPTVAVLVYWAFQLVSHEMREEYLTHQQQEPWFRLWFTIAAGMAVLLAVFIVGHLVIAP